MSAHSGSAVATHKHSSWSPPCSAVVGRSVRERGLVGSGFPREGLLGEVVQDSFVEGGEGVELGGGEQVDEMPADVVHVLGRCVLDGAASGGQKADHGAAAIGGVGFAGNQPSLLHAPDLVGEPALLPMHEGTQFLRGHAALGQSREDREDLVVGPRQPRVLEQVLIQVRVELVTRVHEGPPSAVFAGVEPVRFHRHAPILPSG
jgi:hypothetical protein